MRIDSITELLATIDALPADERAAARRRVDAALDGPARHARAALGLLALDLVGREQLGAAGADATSTAPTVIVLPELVATAPRDVRADRATV